MNSIIVKLVLTSLLIAAATLAARRWGEIVAGWAVGLPLTSGPTSVFFAVEQGPAFAADAAVATLLGLVATAAFFIGYILGTRSSHKIMALFSGITIYLASVWGLSFLPSDLGTAVLLVVLALSAVLFVLRTPPAAAERTPPAWWDLPLRIFTATTLVVLITGGAQRLGPRWSGLLSPFPVFTCVMATFAYYQGGAVSALRLIRGVVMGLFAFMAFFVVVTLLVEHLPLAPVYGLATLAALGVNGVSLMAWVRKGPAVRQQAELIEHTN
jgi:hypothetical protein